MIQGLSPRVRGNPDINPAYCKMARSIPACAGEPPDSGGLILRPEVYPRVCGGTAGISTRPVTLRGLSPRVRGNRVNLPQPCYSARSIPACAGEPRAGQSTRQYEPVYPRVCGGTRLLPKPTMPRAGLSPRVRGNQHPNDGNQPLTRSIPACAGEPTAMRQVSQMSTVYPRVCGGTPRCWVTADGTVGLSPRVRGNRRRKFLAYCCAGSIPACAGEPMIGWPSAVTSTGLSPRVRGNPTAILVPALASRSIPACAGEPSPISPRVPSAAVYPRVCGGTSDHTKSTASSRGLSPRVRGNPVDAFPHTTASRSIPACAGEPGIDTTRAPLIWVYPRVCGGTGRVETRCSPFMGLSPRVRGNLWGCSASDPG